MQQLPSVKQSPVDAGQFDGQDAYPGICHHNKIGRLFRSGAYRCLWLVVLAVFIGYGAKGLRDTPQENPRGENGNPYCGTDGILLKTLAVPHASRQILDELASTHQGDRIVVFWAGNQGNNILGGYLLSYLSWPHETWLVQMDKDHLEKAVDDFRKASFKTAFFYGLSPPGTMKGVKRIGYMFISPLGPRK